MVWSAAEKYALVAAKLYGDWRLEINRFMESDGSACNFVRRVTKDSALFSVIPITANIIGMIFLQILNSEHDLIVKSKKNKLVPSTCNKYITNAIVNDNLGLS